MQNNDRKAYNKYVVLLSEQFDKLKKKSIRNENVTPIEKELITVLNDEKLAPDLRLRKYQQILFRQLHSRVLNDPALANHPSGIEKKKVDIRNRISTSNSLARNSAVDKSSQTKFTRDDIQ